MSFLLVVGILFQSNAQERKVTGKITSAADGSGLPSVTVKAQNVQHEVTSDASGNFTITVPSSNKVTIVLEKKGYKTYKREGLMLREGMVINFNIANLEESEEEVFHPLSRMMDGFR